MQVMQNFYANRRGSITFLPTRTTAYRVRVDVDTESATLFSHHGSQSNDTNEVKARVEVKKHTTLATLTSVIGCEIRKLNPFTATNDEGNSPPSGAPATPILRERGVLRHSIRNNGPFHGACSAAC